MPGLMERINLNIPADARKQLRELARLKWRTESEIARGLLVDALARAKREEFFRAIAKAQTPEFLARDLEILRAFERLGG